MPATDVNRLGLLGSDSLAADNDRSADSGDTTITGSPQTITATVPAQFDGTQPLVKQGWVSVSVSGRSGGGTQGQIDITIDDGTNIVRVDSIPAAATLIANQGVNIVRPIMAFMTDSLTTIKNVNAIIASATANNGTARVVFNGSN